MLTLIKLACIKYYTIDVSSGFPLTKGRHTQASNGTTPRLMLVLNEGFHSKSVI